MIQPKPSNAEVTTAIIELLKTCPVGGIVTHAQLDQVRGFSRHGSNRNVRTVAINRLAREGIRFQTLFNRGYKRLATDETPILHKKDSVKVGRIARKSVQLSKAVLTFNNDISDATKKEHYRYQMKFGLMNLLSQEKFSPPLKEEASKPLPLKVAAKAFYEQVTGRR